MVLFSLTKIHLFQSILEENNILEYKKEINLCDLEITTDNHRILSNCIISDSWRDNLDVMSSQIFEKNYEKSGTKRRIFNIEFKDNTQITKSAILINNVEVSSTHGNKYLNPKLFSIKVPYLLEQGDSFDFIIEYNCIRKWDDIKISLNITGEHKNIKTQFLYKKICETTYKNKPNFTYFFLVISFIIIIFLCRHDFLINSMNFVQINIQEIMQTKNAENIFMISSLILVIILFFIIIGYIKIISFIFSSLMSIICIKSFIKSIFKILIPKITYKLEQKEFYIKTIKFEMSNIITYCLSILIYFFWFISENYRFYTQIILNNCIVFIIIYFSEHKINWQSFYFVILMFLVVFIYQCAFLFYIDGIPTLSSNTVYNITTKLMINIPIRFILPDFIKSPYDEIYFFSIVDSIICGFIIRYCENSAILSEKYFNISLYASYIGLLFNLLLFYCFRFAPPMHMLPSLFSILSVIIYSVIKKETWIFFDLEEQRKEKQDIIFERDNEDDFNFYTPPNHYSGIFSNVDLKNAGPDNFSPQEKNKEKLEK